jgi:galactokinase
MKQSIVGRQKSDVPLGAGLSSSAAIECAVVFALNELLETKNIKN